MDILKTSLGLTKTIKNMSRLKEIIAVLARNGLDEFIIKTGLTAKIPNFVLPKSRIDKALSEYDQASWPETLGYRLRKSFEELGPSFVKLGQLLSTREDIFPQPFIVEMKKLQDQVKGIEFSEATKVIEESLGTKWEDVFSEIQIGPIGTASIGVVYRGQLKTGESVVIKVRRPDIAKTITTDFSLLDFVLTQIEKVSEEIRYLGMSKIVRDFGKHLHTELDYRIEAMNAKRLAENMAKLDENKVFHLPKVYEEHSSQTILVLEFIDGVAFSDAAQINEHKEIIQKQLEKGLKVFVHSILSDGFFHADLHGGNFFLMKDHRIGIVDFGLVGSLSKRSRTSLVAMLYSLVTNNYENLVYEFLEVAEYDNIPDVDVLIRDIRDALSPFVGLTVQQTNVSVLFRAIFSTLARHQIYLPREWFVVFRAMMSLDGVGKSLDMDFDLFSLVDEELETIINKLVSKEQVIEEAVWIGRDLLSAMRGVPRHLRWFLKESSKRGYALEIIQKGYEKEIKNFTSSVKFLGTALLSGILGFSGVYLIKTPLQTVSDVPVLTWVFWSFSFILAATGYWQNRKS
jgi:ubiquinone biosynthesis protein